MITIMLLRTSLPTGPRLRREASRQALCARMPGLLFLNFDFFLRVRTKHVLIHLNPFNDIYGTDNLIIFLIVKDGLFWLHFLYRLRSFFLHRLKNTFDTRLVCHKIKPAGTHQDIGSYPLIMNHPSVRGKVFTGSQFQCRTVRQGQYRLYRSFTEGLITDDYHPPVILECSGNNLTG